ncbi:MAG TPA: Tim44-like domain-containing protein [Bradyrhizobium sp.]|nr:Tim44-like domain-containing protein [Bradyrhizobium sp.]
MKFAQRARCTVKALAIALSLALPLVAVTSSADARIGGGASSGSRGSRTFSAPPSTSTAPNTAQPFNRTITQPSSTGLGASGGFFNRPGMGMLGGLAAGFLGAGLLGMLFGGGLFGGIGGFSSILGLLLQIGLIVFAVRLLMSWWQRRHETAAAYAGGGSGAGAAPSFLSAAGFGLGSGGAPLEILPADYEAFERLLGETQAAWSDEDIPRLHTLATPEMVSYFTRDLDQNRARNVVNKVFGTRLLQGDLAEAWREGNTDYASVAMRYSLVDKTMDRTTGRMVEGSDQPMEVTEVWTFMRPRGGTWELSGIQQT